tara:strand:- start:5619 stop:6221 length:603 start_codon:yes stop_codon:yes gene_type:complete
MKELIKINEDETVNAKDLWEKLEVSTRFNDWIGRRIKEYGFELNKDFYSFLSKSTGGRKNMEYHVSLDMAKELSMVEKTKIGKVVRKYFIDCEKKLREYSSIRLAGKITRKTLTDKIKESGENERMHGHGYSNYTKMIYKMCGIEYKKMDNFRDTLTKEELHKVETIEAIVKGAIELGHEYRDIKALISPMLAEKLKLEV